RYGVPRRPSPRTMGGWPRGSRWGCSARSRCAATVRPWRSPAGSDPSPGQHGTLAVVEHLVVAFLELVAAGGDPDAVAEDGVLRDVERALGVDVDPVPLVPADRVAAHRGPHGLADQPDTILAVAAHLVVRHDVVAPGLGDGDAGLGVVVDLVAADRVAVRLVDVDPLGGVVEHLVALDDVVVRPEVHHDAVVLVGVDDVVAHDAVHAVLGEDDPVLAVVVHPVALDRHVALAGVRVDAVED